MSVLIVIPARMKATRLPDKPLAMIGGVSMIVQVWRRAVESGVGDVVVACDGEAIAEAVRAEGGVVVVTDPDHPSGSDRVWEAVRKVESRIKSRELREEEGSLGVLEMRVVADSSSKLQGSESPALDVQYNIIINLQGDVPTLEPRLLKEILLPLENPAVDIATLVAPISRAEEYDNPSVVKAVLSFPQENDRVGRALYFTRAIAPYGEGVRYHHIGVYAYRRKALAEFVALPPSPLERREKLEQLRALEAGMRIDAVVVDTVPLGVDTPEDLARAQAIFLQ